MWRPPYFLNDNPQQTVFILKHDPEHCITGFITEMCPFMFWMMHRYHPRKRGDNVFTLGVCVHLCHNVCPDDLTMKDCCHTNNILQAHSWRCLVMQVMLHALMTSPMTSAGPKVSQILKLLYLHQYFSYSVDQNLKISEMPMTILLVYWTSGITSCKKTTSKWRPFWNIKHSFNLTLDMKR